MNKLTIMLWLIVILAAVGALPVARDPYDLVNKVDEERSESANLGDLDLLEFVLKQVTSLSKTSVDGLFMNTNEKDEIDVFLDALEKYMALKHSGNNDLENGLEPKLPSMPDAGNGISEELLSAIVHAIDGDVKGIIEELIDLFTKALEKEERIARQNGDHKSYSEFSSDLHEIERLVEALRFADLSARLSEKMSKRESPQTALKELPTELHNVTSDSGRFLKVAEDLLVLGDSEYYSRISGWRLLATKDNSKEAPIVDVDVEVASKTTMDYSMFNLKIMYEKRGGICMLIHGYSKTPIYVISTCRLGYTRSSNAWELCEHSPQFSSRLHQENIIDISQTPVQDSEGFVYKNVYCAQCNDVTSVQAWTTKLECDHMQSLSLFNGQDRVTLMKEFADKTMGCARRLTPAVPRMIHQCSHVDVIDEMLYHTNRIGDVAKADHSPFPLSFSILMNFGFDGKTHILFTTTASAHSVSVTCNPNEKWDPQFQKCRPIVCYDGYQLVNGACVKIGNFDANSNPDDISNLNDIEDPLQVILTIKNITYGEIYELMVRGIEGTIQTNLATMFNISVDRIQNVTINLVNTTGLANHTGDSIEIHRFTTPLPSKRITTVKWHKQLHEPFESVNLSGLDESTKRSRDSDQGYKTYMDSSVELEMFDESESESNAIQDGGEHDSLEELLTEHTPSNHNNVRQENRGRVGPEKSHGLDKVHTEDESDFNSTYVAAVTDEFWSPVPGLSIRISFILKPAHTNRTIIEKSVKTVVQTMSDLVNSNAFMLAINGTDFQVQTVENAPHVTSMDDFCTKGIKPLLEDPDFNLIQEFDSRIQDFVTVIVVNKTGARYYPGEYDLTFNIDGNVGNLNQTVVTSWVFVCKMPKILDEKCGRVVLDKVEYRLFENKSIGFSNRVYNMSEYEYQKSKDDTVVICTPADWINMQLLTEASNWTLACGEDLIKVAIAESYLTFILGVISLICMLSVLITYGLFDKLRNLPGANTVNLTFSLFLGELVFITSGWIQPHLEWLCSAVGMLLHYLFLASFFWMNVMAYDVFRTFGNKCILTRVRNKKKYLPRYAVYAWGMPLLIVTFCGVLDFTNLIDSVKIGYGGKAASGSVQVAMNTSDVSPEVYSIGCWIQQPVASMIAFGGPMMLILLTNVVMFTKTIICIRASTQNARTSVRKPSMKHMTGKDDVMLYIRMSTVMGFTWIFGLASSVVSALAGPTYMSTCIILHLLGILFIVFNCSQGIFIFFAFVFNRRVCAMYKALMERIKTGRPRPLSISSSRGTLATNLSQSSFSHIT